MSRIKFYLLFLLSIPVSGFSKDIVDDGLTHVYNLEFDKAQQVFRQIQSSDPHDIKGHFYESVIYFYRAIATRQDDNYEKYLDISSDVIDRAEDLIDKNEKNYDAIYFKGLSHSYRSLLMLTLNKNLLSAASNGNDGYRTLSSLLKMKPDYYDAYMGLGLYKIVLGYVPEKFRWLLSIIGFDGNIRDGKNLLHTAMNNGKYTRVESKVFLAFFSIREREEEDYSAFNYAKSLTEEFPSSPVFKILFSGVSLQAGDMNASKKAAQDALELNSGSLQDEVRKGANALLGTAYFRENNYPEAIAYLEKALMYVNDNDRYNVYLFTLGSAYELIGQRGIALNKYRAVRNKYIDERDGETEKIFYRYAQERIKAPISKFDSLLITGQNLRETKKYEEAIGIYKYMIEGSMLNTFSTDNHKIRLYTDLASAYVLNDEPDRALEYLNKAVTLKPSVEKWLVPNSYFEMGKIYSRAGNNPKAEEMFEKIDDYDDYDDYEFKQFLEMRLANYRNR